MSTPYSPVLPEPPAPPRLEEAAQGPPAPLPEPERPQVIPGSGYAGAGGRIANIASGFLRGWMQGKAHAEQVAWQREMQIEGHLNSTYRAAMQQYQQVLDDPKSSDADKGSSRTTAQAAWGALADHYQKMYDKSQQGKPKTAKKKTGLLGKVEAAGGRVKQAMRPQLPITVDADTINIMRSIDPTRGMRESPQAVEAQTRLKEEDLRYKVASLDYQQAQKLSDLTAQYGEALKSGNTQATDRLGPQIALLNGGKDPRYTDAVSLGTQLDAATGTYKFSVYMPATGEVKTVDTKVKGETPTEKVQAEMSAKFSAAQGFANQVWPSLPSEIQKRYSNPNGLAAAILDPALMYQLGAGGGAGTGAASFIPGITMQNAQSVANNSIRAVMYDDIRKGYQRSGYPAHAVGNPDDKAAQQEWLKEHEDLIGTWGPSGRDEYYLRTSPPQDYVTHDPRTFWHPITGKTTEHHFDQGQWTKDYAEFTNRLRAVVPHVSGGQNVKNAADFLAVINPGAFYGGLASGMEQPPADLQGAGAPPPAAGAGPTPARQPSSSAPNFRSQLGRLGTGEHYVRLKHGDSWQVRKMTDPQIAAARANAPAGATVEVLPDNQ